MPVLISISLPVRLAPSESAGPRLTCSISALVTLLSKASHHNFVFLAHSPVATRTLNIIWHGVGITNPSDDRGEPMGTYALSDHLLEVSPLPKQTNSLTDHSSL